MLFTPLITLCSNGNIELVEYFVQHAADINLSTNSGDTPLLVACEFRNLDVIKYSIKHGVDINYSNNDGNTPLIVSCILHVVDDEVFSEDDSENSEEVNNVINEKIDIVKYLIDNGANIEHENIVEYFSDQWS